MLLALSTNQSHLPVDGRIIHLRTHYVTPCLAGDPHKLVFPILVAASVAFLFLLKRIISRSQLLCDTIPSLMSVMHNQHGTFY
jgi:hypothetical protein